MNLPDHINGLEQEGRNQVLIPGIKRGSFQAPIIPKTGNSKDLDDSANAWEFRTRASLKIQDGCDFMCSFCIIPLQGSFSLSGFQQPDGGSPTTE